MFWALFDNLADNFKSLKTKSTESKADENSEFEQQRKAALKEALQAKSSSGGVKTFGGGKLVSMSYF